MPHVPQLVVVLSCVSQPLAGFRSQSAKPVLQVPLVQVPVLQLAAALGKLHATLHAPQSVFVLSGLSQPLLGRPSQFAKPLAQVEMVQLLLVHDVMPTLASALQLVPQPPQLVGVVMLTSQPLPAWLSQLRKPGEQVSSHIPLLQPAPVVLGRPVQSLVQLPQLAGSVMLVSQLVPFMSQSRWVLAQVSTRQLPVAQVAVAFAMAQVVPQEPQLLRVRVFVSQPSVTSPLQFAKPVAQVI